MNKVYNMEEQMSKVCKVSLKIKRNARNKKIWTKKEYFLQIHLWTQKAEERISGLEDRAIENPQSELQNEKSELTTENGATI